MSREKIEQICTSIGVISLLLLAFSAVIAIADGIFRLDLLPEQLEKFAYLIMAILFITVVSSVLVSIMMNISIIAQRMSRLLELFRDESIRKNQHEQE